MSTAWNQMKRARVQVAIESVLLKAFDKPLQSLERRVIQSADFRAKVLPIWADYSLNTSTPFTESNLQRLSQVKIRAPVEEDTNWFLSKISTFSATPTPSEVRAPFPEELSLSGPKYPFQPRHLMQLQRKTDTLTGRELTMKIDVQSTELSKPINSGRVIRRRHKEQLAEYRWRIEDDDDNLKEDLLSPKYSSF